MFWGIVSVLVGSWFGYATARNLFFSSWSSVVNPECRWLLASLLPFSAMAVYFVWVGKNQLQRAGGQEVKKPQFRWGRLLSGFYLTFFALKSHFAPGLNRFKPDNDAQAIGMSGANVMILSVGVLLLAFAFSPVKQKLSGEASSIDTR